MSVKWFWKSESRSPVYSILLCQLLQVTECSIQASVSSGTQLAWKKVWTALHNFLSSLVRTPRYREEVMKKSLRIIRESVANFSSHYWSIIIVPHILQDLMFFLWRLTCRISLQVAILSSGQMEPSFQVLFKNMKNNFLGLKTDPDPRPTVKFVISSVFHLSFFISLQGLATLQAH